MSVCYLVSKEHFDGESPCSRRDVLDSDGVIGVGDDVKVYVLLLVADDVGITFDTDAHVSCGKHRNGVQR